VSNPFDPNSDFFRAQVSEIAKIARIELERADKHPLGHIACELVRAKVRKSLTADDVIRIAAEVEALGKK